MDVLDIEYFSFRGGGWVDEARSHRKCQENKSLVKFNEKKSAAH